MKYISIDLEMEQPGFPDSKVKREKIIQVGWTIFSTDPIFQIHDTKQYWINIGVPITSYIKKLTGVKDEDIANGITLQQAYQLIVQDRNNYESSRIVRQWGGGDMEFLKNELERERNKFINKIKRFLKRDKEVFEWEFGRSGLNVKHLFQTYAQANDIKWHGGLSKCMAKCGLNWRGRGKHQAGVDSLNTAVMFDFLYQQYKRQ